MLVSVCCVLCVHALSAVLCLLLIVWHFLICYWSQNGSVITLASNIFLLMVSDYCYDDQRLLESSLRNKRERAVCSLFCLLLVCVLLLLGVAFAVVVVVCVTVVYYGLLVYGWLYVVCALDVLNVLC